jgi:hypothetical protein
MFQVFHLVLGKLDEQEEVMIKIEKAINPLIDDQDQVHFLPNHTAKYSEHLNTRCRKDIQ